MRNGQLVKLKPHAELVFSDSEWGSISYINECESCYCIFLSYSDITRTCEVLLDGAIGFNVNPTDLEEM